MTDDVKKNGPYDPATDEQLEYWQVQLEYGDKPVIGPIERGAFGRILARLAEAEEDRDEARRELCEFKAADEAEHSGALVTPSAAEYAEEMYGMEEALRLFPPVKPA